MLTRAIFALTIVVIEVTATRSWSSADTKGTTMEKKTYNAPELKDLGSVTEQTLTGQTQAGTDGKAGSRPSSGQ